jgi:hypothetical protein
VLRKAQTEQPINTRNAIPYMDYMNSSKQNSDWFWEIIDNENKNLLPVRLFVGIKNLKDKIEAAKAARRK